MSEDAPRGRENMKNQVRPSLDGRQSGPTSKSVADTWQMSTNKRINLELEL